MAILWAGQEDVDFPNGNAIGISADGGRYRPGYARGEFNLNNAPSAAWSNAFPGGAITECWFSTQFYLAAGGNFDSYRVLGIIKAGASAKGIYIGSHGANTLAIYSYDGTNYTMLAEEAVASFTGLTKVDVHIAGFGSNPGTITAYTFGGTSAVISYSGDLSGLGVSDLDAVWLSPQIAGTSIGVSEMIVADEDTRTLGLITLAPSAAGDTNDWTGAYSDIDETTLSDADMVYSNVDAKDFQCNMSDMPAGDYAIKGIWISARALATADATVSGLKIGVKSGGSIDVDSGRDLTTVWTEYSRWTETINGGQLTKTLLDAIQLDLQTVAVPSSSPSSSVSSSTSASASAS